MRIPLNWSGYTVLDGAAVVLLAVDFDKWTVEVVRADGTMLEMSIDSVKIGTPPATSTGTLVLHLGETATSIVGQAADVIDVSPFGDPANEGFRMDERRRWNTYPAYGNSTTKDALAQRERVQFLPYTDFPLRAGRITFNYVPTVVYNTGSWNVYYPPHDSLPQEFHEDGEVTDQDSGAKTITDSSASMTASYWVGGELVIDPDRNTHPTASTAERYTIVDNDATTFWVAETFRHGGLPVGVGAVPLKWDAIKEPSDPHTDHWMVNFNKSGVPNGQGIRLKYSYYPEGGSGNYYGDSMLKMTIGLFQANQLMVETQQGLIWNKDQEYSIELGWRMLGEPPALMEGWIIIDGSVAAYNTSDTAFNWPQYLSKNLTVGSRDTQPVEATLPTEQNVQGIVRDFKIYDMNGV